jgi:hypothetical protein
MRNRVQSYLSDLYHISTNEVGNDGVYALSDTRKFKSPVYGDKFLTELVDIFAYDEDTIKSIVYEWAVKQKPDVDLTYFWTTKELLLDGIFPIVQAVAARTIAQDLVSVQPMSGPTGQLFYMDYQYSPTQSGRTQTHYEIADNDANTRFNNMIQQLADNQNNYRLGELDHPDLDN